MQFPHGITASAFRMKFFKLLLLAALSAIILIGCERQFVSPIKDVPEPPQINTQFAQNALSDLADTANKRAFLNLANAASGVAETLATDDGTSVEPIYSKIAKLADEVTVLEIVYVEAGCEIEFQDFAEASVDAVKAYTVRDAADMEQALQNLAQGAVTAEKVLQQLPAENVFVPFAFGYGLSWCGASIRYAPGEFWIQFDTATRPVNETRTAVIEFLANKGYSATVEKYPIPIDELRNYETVNLGVDVYLPFLMKELVTVPGVAVVVQESRVDPPYGGPPEEEGPPVQSNLLKAQQVIERVRTKYNQAWCQGNFDVINNILIEESGLAFFDYTFVRNLADIYAEEIPERAERIRTNRFSLESIAGNFLAIYFQDSEKTLDEIIVLFRQFAGHVSLEHPAACWRYHGYSKHWDKYWDKYYYGIENEMDLPQFFWGER